jgi:hypothetical protein
VEGKQRVLVRTLSERELLLCLGQALPLGTPPELSSATVAVIAECDSDRCFEEGLHLSHTSRAHWARDLGE